MTLEDCNKLQVIQRLLTGVRKGKPTKKLPERTGSMSVNHEDGGVPHLVNGAQGHTNWQTGVHRQEARD